MLDYVLPYSNQRVDQIPQQNQGQRCGCRSEPAAAVVLGKGRYFITFLSLRPGGEAPLAGPDLRVSSDRVPPDPQRCTQAAPAGTVRAGCSRKAGYVVGDDPGSTVYTDHFAAGDSTIMSGRRTSRPR